MPSHYTMKDFFAPDATNAHSNIDDLLLQAEMELQPKHTIGVHRPVKPIGGLDPITESIALSPIMTLKSLGSMGRKLLKNLNLKNPVYHHTEGIRASNILKEGTIRGGGEFPGKPFYKDSRKYLR